jgi:hypothetical protein
MEDRAAPKLAKSQTDDIQMFPSIGFYRFCVGKIHNFKNGGLQVFILLKPMEPIL